MAVTLTYDTQLSRVRVAVTALGGTAVTMRLERSTSQIKWSTVRGGVAAAVSGGTGSLDDYEFVTGVPNYYRATGYNVSNVQVSQQTSTITPTIDRVWLKSPARPFLNRPVTVQDFGDVERYARSGVHDVVGRSNPVVVSDVRGSRRWPLDLLAHDQAEAATLDLILASGDVLFIQVPAGCDVPGGYVAVGDTAMRRPARRSVRRLVTLPCVEVNAPGPDVVGATITCQGVLNAYASCSAVSVAHSTCASLLELIGTPEDVITS